LKDTQRDRDGKVVNVTVEWYEADDESSCYSSKYSPCFILGTKVPREPQIVVLSILTELATLKRGHIRPDAIDRIKETLGM